MMRIARIAVGLVMAGTISVGMPFAYGQSAAPTTPPTPPAPAGRQNRPPPPTRDPRTPGYVTATNATELPDGAVPPVDVVRATSSSGRRTRPAPK